jgi:histidinol-phosphate/aromatic aminotransferase/cobyric acid decarboxylase-like protein
VAEIEAIVFPAPRARVQAMKEYHPPLGNRDELRLDFNENTLACSPKVREALSLISTGDLTVILNADLSRLFVAAASWSCCPAGGAHQWGRRSNSRSV